MKKKNKSSGKTRDVNTLLSSTTKPREIDIHEGSEGKKTGSENNKATNKKNCKEKLNKQALLFQLAIFNQYYIFNEIGSTLYSYILPF
jgi:hypothetical protein